MGWATGGAYLGRRPATLHHSGIHVCALNARLVRDQQRVARFGALCCSHCAAIGWLPLYPSRRGACLAKRMQFRFLFSQSQGSFRKVKTRRRR
eukprot:3346710-Pleurochrysis_carterae.AAC.3